MVIYFFFSFLKGSIPLIPFLNSQFTYHTRKFEKKNTIPFLNSQFTFRN
jgi:hypothetical protein